MSASFRLLLILSILSLSISACAPTTPGDIPIRPVETAANNPFNIDPATTVAVDFRRSGGSDGVNEHAQLYKDGHVVLAHDDEEIATFHLAPEEVSEIDALFEAIDFHRQARHVEPIEGQVADGYQYEITRKGMLVETVLRTQEGAVPDWAVILVDLLSTLLLTPRAANDYSSQVAASAQEQGAGRTLLVDFRRTGGPDNVDDRVQVYLDRSYTVSRNGVLEAGLLTDKEVGSLLRMMEVANFKENQGNYMPEDTCCDQYAYEVTYRNLYGIYRARGMDNAMPRWFKVVAAALVKAFIDIEQLTAAMTEAAPQAQTVETEVVEIQTPAPEEIAEAPEANATAVPEEEPSAEPAAETTPEVEATPAAGEVPTTTVALSETIASGEAITATASLSDTETAGPATFTLTDLEAALAAAGAEVVPAGGPNIKPYLSVFGSFLQVNGQMLQVFEYDDPAALQAEIAGLAPDASEIDGLPLAWAAAPHFWQQDSLLVLAVADDQTFVDLLSSILGPQFAGQ